MSESSAKQKAVLWVAVVFVLGAALGGVFGYFFGHRSSVSAANPPLSEAVKRAQRVQELTQELGLTDDQRQQLDKALSQLHARVQIDPRPVRCADGAGAAERPRPDPLVSNPRTETEIRGISKAHGRRKKAEPAAASTALVLHT